MAVAVLLNFKQGIDVAAGLQRRVTAQSYGAGFLAKRGCCAHCCAIGVEASAAQGELEPCDASGVIVSTIERVAGRMEDENIPPPKHGGAETGVAGGSAGTLLSGD